MKYLICYELVSEEPEYDSIAVALKNMRARQVFPTVWIYEEIGMRDNTSKLQNHLRDFLHSKTDELLVVRLARSSKIRIIGNLQHRGNRRLG